MKIQFTEADQLEVSPFTAETNRTDVVQVIVDSEAMQHKSPAAF